MKTDNKVYKIHTHFDTFTLNTGGTATQTTSAIEPNDHKEGITFFGSTTLRTGLTGYVEISNDKTTFTRTDNIVIFTTHNDFAINTSSFKARYYRVRFTTTHNSDETLTIHSTYH